MKKIKKAKKKQDSENLRTFFLACELKPRPKSDLWSIIEPFAYDIIPAFIHGSLGITSYDPTSYAIIDINENSQPLIGYIMTITHPGTILLLDKLKGANGTNSFNCHYKKVVNAYTDIEESVEAWCYVLSNSVLDNYRQIEQIEFGIFDDEDEAQAALLDKIEGGELS